MSSCAILRSSSVIGTPSMVASGLGVLRQGEAGHGDHRGQQDGRSERGQRGHGSSEAECHVVGVGTKRRFSSSLAACQQVAPGRPKCPPGNTIRGAGSGRHDEHHPHRGAGSPLWRAQRGLAGQGGHPPHPALSPACWRPRRSMRWPPPGRRGWIARRAATSAAASSSPMRPDAAAARPARQQPDRFAAQHRARSARRPAVPHSRLGHDAADQRPGVVSIAPICSPPSPSRASRRAQSSSLTIDRLFPVRPRDSARRSVESGPPCRSGGGPADAGDILAICRERRVGGPDYDREWPERAKSSMW
jgi:hypothetical protein